MNQVEREEKNCEPLQTKSTLMEAEPLPLLSPSIYFPGKRTRKKRGFFFLRIFFTKELSTNRHDHFLAVMMMKSCRHLSCAPPFDLKLSLSFPSSLSTILFVSVFFFLVCPRRIGSLFLLRCYSFILGLPRKFNGIFEVLYKLDSFDTTR